VANDLQDEVRGAEFLPPVGALKARLEAQVVSSSRLISISVHLKEEEGGERNAAILINKLIEQLQSDISKEEKSETQSRMGIVGKVIDEMVIELNGEKQKKQNELFDFMEQNGIPRIWREEFTQILTERRKSEVLIENTTDSIKVAKLELEKLGDELKKHPELVEYSQTLTENPVLLGLMENLLRVDSLIAKASEDLGANLGELKGLEAQKTTMESQIQTFTPKTTLSITKAVSPTHLALLDRKINVEFRIAKAEHLLKTYEERFKEVNAKLGQLVKNIPQKEYRYGEIAASINRLEGLGIELLRRKVDAQIVMRQSDTDSKPFKGGILVIDPARPKRAPVSPNLTRIWAAAMFIGIAIGFAAAWGLEYLSNAENK